MHYLLLSSLRFFVPATDISQHFAHTRRNYHLKNRFFEVRSSCCIGVIFHPEQLAMRSELHLCYFIEPFQGPFYPVYSGIA